MNTISTEQDLKKYRNDLNFLRPIIENILEKERMSLNKIHIFDTGSSIIVDIGNHQVLKIFPLFLKQDFNSEISSLRLLNQYNIERVPKLYSFGEIKNYSYVIISKIRGITLESIWNKIKLENKISIMAYIGIFLKSIHLIPNHNSLKNSKDWKVFLEKQVLNCCEHHAKLGMTQALISQIEKFTSLHLPMQTTPKNICFLSGDVHYWNILIEEKNGEYQISGFIDYGDSFYGLPEYDFLAPGAFMAKGGNSELLSAMFLGYGYKKEELNKELSHRMFAFHLIHRFSNFSNLGQIMTSKNLYKISEKLWGF
jgi:hygromycin-B 7''-O-kinase